MWQIFFASDVKIVKKKEKTYSNKLAMMLETGAGTGTYEMITGDSWSTDCIRLIRHF